MDLSKDEVKSIQDLEEEFQRNNRPHFTLENHTKRWREFVQGVNDGYKLTIYDYTNELSVRSTIEDFLKKLPAHVEKKLYTATIQPIDDEFAASTEPSTKVLLSGAEDFQQRPWWYHRVPKKLVGELEEDLKTLD